MHFRHESPARPARAIHLTSTQTPRQRLRIVGALVGLTLVVAGLLTARPAHAADAQAAAPTASAASAASASQGTVESVEAVEVKGKGSGVGAVAGAVLGGLLGNHMGRGTGNTLMTIGGAAAGGYAGNEVEKNVKKHTVYKTRVKLDDGSVHTYTVNQPFEVGTRVHVNGKQLTAQ
jgi:outer membrane lipoprotein SlyB